MSGNSVEILPVAPMTMHCANRHQWTEHWPMPCLMPAMATRMDAASTCPRCGAKTFLGAAKVTPA